MNLGASTVAFSDRREIRRDAEVGMTGAIFDLMPSDSKDGFGRSGSRLHSGFEIGLTNGLDAAVFVAHARFQQSYSVTKYCIARTLKSQLARGGRQK